MSYEPRKDRASDGMKLIEISRTSKLCITVVLVAVVTGVHYSGIPHDYMSAAVALYIIPVSYAAVVFGVRGGVAVGLFAAAAAVPHSLLFHPRVETIAEIGAIIILLVSAVMVGGLANRARAHKAHLESTASQLRASESRYRQLFENAGDAILVCASDGTIVASNDAAEKLTGRTRHEIEGSKLKHLWRRRSWHDTGDDELPVNGQVPSRAYRYLTRNAEPGKLVEATLAPLQDAKVGKTGGWMIIMREANETQETHYVMRNYIRGITRAQEEERKRIARELHDVAIQTLIAASRRIDALEGTTQQTTTVAKDLNDVRHLVGDTIQSLRHFSRDLRPSVLDDLGLIPAVEWLTQHLSDLKQMRATLDVRGEPRRLSTDKELLLFRIVQEALANVEKHSHATEVEVTIMYQPHKLEMTVCDNGIGFDLAKISGDEKAQQKLGILGMQERASLLGGSLIIDSQSGHGTLIRLDIDTDLDPLS